MDSSFCSTTNGSILFLVNGTHEQKEFCENITRIATFLYFRLCQVTFFLYATLFVLTISIKIKEDYKWFILHSISLNFLVSGHTAIYEIFFHNQFEITDETILSNLIFHNFLKNLSYISCFPIALNRFAHFYFPNSYKSHHNTKNLFVFIVLFDFVMLIFNFMTRATIFYILYIIFILLILFLSIILSVLIFRKIYCSTKFLQSSTFTNTLQDARRASIYCLVEATLRSIILFMYLYNTIFASCFILIRATRSFNVWLSLYLLFTGLLEVFFQIILIVDSLMVLFLLKTYRTLIFKLFCNLTNSIARKWRKIVHANHVG